MARYVGKRIVPKHCGYWDNTQSYEMQNIVYDRASGNSYISRKAVPAGTDISQDEYWALCSDFNMQMDLLEKHFTATEQRIVADNDATEQAIRADNQETCEHVDSSLEQTTNVLTGTVNSARDAMTAQKAEFDQTAQQLNTRMDAVLAAGTGDGQTEIADARVDGVGHTYDSLGQHIRTLTADQNDKRNTLEAKLDRMLLEVRTSNNFLDPERLDKNTWDPETYKGHYVPVNPTGTISALTPTEMYAFCGNWDIRGLGLSGKKIVCNYPVRFLSLTKTPLSEGNYIRSAEDCKTILTTTGGAAKGTEIQMPEFDENVFPYLNFTIQYWSECVLFGGEETLYMSDHLPYSNVDVDEYAVKVIAPEGIIIDNIVEQIREFELQPNKAAFFRKIESTNLFNRADDGITPLWAYGTKWELSNLYYGTALIPIPPSRKIITNFRFRGLSLYSNSDVIPYDGTPEDGGRVCPETTTVTNSQVEGRAGEVYDLTGYSNRYKYIRLWIYRSGFATQDAIGWYVADAENYKESLWEDYYDSYFVIKSEYIPGYKTSELIDDVGFVKSGDPVSTLENDAGYLTEAIERVAITPQNSDRIMLLGDSYTESSFTVRGKAYINKLSLFSDYVFENMALSGDIYYGNIDRIRTGAQQYGLSFEEARPKFAMMCCFTNDIKTLTADQYADALRRACEEVIGRGVIPIICTEYHAIYNIPNIVSVNEQVAREYGCPCWDIASIVQIVRGTDHAPYWGGSHAGTRPNALQSDNYEKFLQTLERPNHSIKLFRLRDSYALSSTIYCSHCGDIFQRTQWFIRDERLPVWRCACRLNRRKSKIDCPSRTLYESELHAAVVRAINQVIAQKDDLLPGLKIAIEKALGSGNGTRVAEIDAQLEDLEKELLKRANAKQDYTDILEQLDTMRDAKQELLLEDANNAGVQRHLNEIEAFLETQQTDIEEYDDDLVRRLLERVTVYDDHLTFEFKSGIEIDITM